MSVGVIGLGYVGLPLVVAFAEAGEEVVAVDVDPRKIAAIKAGESYVEDISSERLQAVLPLIHATSHYQPLARTDAVLICVPTPLTPNREPDLAALDAAGHALGQVLQRGQLVVLESTTYPGTTRERLVPILEQESELTVGDEVNVAFSPERVDPGRTDYTLQNTPKVIGGMTAACAERAAELYGRVCDEIVRVSTPEAAEMTKLLENIFRSVNIALVNELAILAERMGIDIWEVVDAAATKPYGFMRFEPGPRDGRPLPAGRPVLSDLARARVPHVDRVHRARRQDQPADALPLRRADRARAQRRRPSPSRAPGSRSSASATRAASATSASRPRCGSWRCCASAARELAYHDPYVPSLPDLGLESSPLEQADRGRRRGRARHRPPGHRPRRDRPRRTAVHRPARRHPRRNTPRTSSGCSRSARHIR